MTVLVTAASKHGATREIAEAIARGLAHHGVSAEVLDLGEVSDLDRFDGVVLGSAVYMGHWLEPARKFVERSGDDLAQKKTWLFSSGPVGEAPHVPKAAEDVCDVDDILAATNAVEHRLFSGKLERVHQQDFTAIAAMQLWERGLVDLDAPRQRLPVRLRLIPAKAAFRPATGTAPADAHPRHRRAARARGPAAADAGLGGDDRCQSPVSVIATQ
jgi:menaquinone-dependent protoporphyrinogen oxidase